MHKISRFCIYTLTLAISSILNAGLASGPMLAHLEMREASIWVQTGNTSTIRINYKASGVDASDYWTDPQKTDPKNGNTATVRLDQVEPGKRYTYQVEVDGELEEETYTFKAPEFYHERRPAPDLRIAIGGAHYVMEAGYEPPYQILGGGYEIFNTIREFSPELMLWAGNTAHLRPSDFNTKSGYLKRFATARNLPELKNLLATIPHYATWGNSDYGQQNAGSYYSYRKYAEEAFTAFWPRPVDVENLEGIASHFRHSDVDFFILDTKSYLNQIASKDTLPQILGPQQVEWLRQELIRSNATFKIIVSGIPILNPSKKKGNLSYAQQEQTDLLDMIRNERIPGVFFISGGKYFGELTRLVHANSYNLYDLTVGPITANGQSNRDELNFFRVPSTTNQERHFALIDVTGPEEDRKLSLRTINVDGRELWSREIKASELQGAPRLD